MVLQSIEITDNGTWLFPPSGSVDGKNPCRVAMRKSTGVDPIGALVKVGIVYKDLAPELIADAELTLPTLATSTASIPVRIFADGTVALVVTGYVAPFFADLIQ